MASLVGTIRKASAGSRRVRPAGKDRPISSRSLPKMIPALYQMNLHQLQTKARLASMSCPSDYCSYQCLQNPHWKQQGPARYGLALISLSKRRNAICLVRGLDLPTYFGGASLKIRDRVITDLFLSGSIKLSKRSVMAVRSSSERRARSAAIAGLILSAAAMFAVATQTK